MSLEICHLCLFFSLTSSRFTGFRLLGCVLWLTEWVWYVKICVKGAARLHRRTGIPFARCFCCLKTFLTVLVMFTELHIGWKCLNLRIFRAFWGQSPLSVPVFLLPHAILSACFPTHFLQVDVCAGLHKVASILFGINRRDVWCGWLSGYDVTLWFQTLDDCDPPGALHILKVQGSAPKKTLRGGESSKSLSALKGTNVMHL